MGARFLLTMSFVASLVMVAPSRGVAQPVDTAEILPRRDDRYPGEPRQGRGPEIASETPVVIDGAIAPDQIPDFVAHRHLVLAIAIPDGASPAETSRRDSLLRAIGLAPDDHGRVLASLRGVRGQLETLAVKRRALGESSDMRALAVVRTQRDLLLTDAYQRLRDALSPRGRDLLDICIATRIKPGIRIYGELPAPRP